MEHIIEGGKIFLGLIGIFGGLTILVYVLIWLAQKLKTWQFILLISIFIFILCICSTFTIS